MLPDGKKRTRKPGVFLSRHPVSAEKYLGFFSRAHLATLATQNTASRIRTQRKRSRKTMKKESPTRPRQKPKCARGDSDLWRICFDEDKSVVKGSILLGENSLDSAATWATEYPHRLIDEDPHSALFRREENMQEEIGHYTRLPGVVSIGGMRNGAPVVRKSKIRCSTTRNLRLRMRAPVPRSGFGEQ